MLRFLPILSTAVIIPFAYIVFQRWTRTRSNPSLLIWGFGLTFYAIGTFTGSLYSMFGWHESWGELNLRIWYLFGAILVAAWLGQDTVFLLWRRIAKPTMIILAIASVYGIYAVFAATVNTSPLIDAPELTSLRVTATISPALSPPDLAPAHTPDHVRLRQRSLTSPSSRFPSLIAAEKTPRRPG